MADLGNVIGGSGESVPTPEVMLTVRPQISLALSASDLPENLGTGALIGLVQVAGTDSAVVALPPDLADNPLFRLIGNQLLSDYVFDSAALSIAQVRLQATALDGIGGFADQIFLITITPNPVSDELQLLGLAPLPPDAPSGLLARWLDFRAWEKRCAPVADGGNPFKLKVMNENTDSDRQQESLWIGGYGLFLLMAGLAGYLSNPAAAKTALISGGTFGTIHLMFGLFRWKGIPVARWMAVTLASLLSPIFLWRASVSWLAVKAGEPKLVAAVIITSMLIASVTLVTCLLLRGRTG